MAGLKKLQKHPIMDKTYCEYELCESTSCTNGLLKKAGRFV